MDNCIFCKIVKGEIPSKKVYEDDLVMAFHDVAPAAPVHVLVIPKEHVLESARAVTAEHAALIGHIYTVIAKLAADKRPTRDTLFDDVEMMKLRNELIRYINRDVASHIE